MRTSQWTWAGVALAALTLSACKDDGGKATTAGGKGGEGGQGGIGGAGPGGQGGQGGQGGVEVTCTDQPGALDLGGVWVGRAEMNASIEGQPGGVVTVCPEDQEGTAELLFVMSMQQEGTGLQDVRAVLCDATLPPVTAVLGTCSPGATGTVTTEILVPDELKGALPKLEVTPVTGTVSEASAGASVTFARLHFTAGASPMVEALPRWKVEDATCDAADIGHSNMCEAACVDTCGALRDHDDDTFPGVTLDVCGRTKDDEGKKCPAEEPTTDGVTLQGRAFTAIRVDPELTGVASSSCEIKGSVNAGIDYSVVGSDVEIAGLSIPVSSVVDALPKLAVNAEKSKVSLVRVDGKYGTQALDLDMNDPAGACQKVREQVNKIF